jgi:hypothetical protein
MFSYHVGAKEAKRDNVSDVVTEVLVKGWSADPVSMHARRSRHDSLVRFRDVTTTATFKSNITTRLGLLQAFSASSSGALSRCPTRRQHQSY